MYMESSVAFGSGGWRYWCPSGVDGGEVSGRQTRPPTTLGGLDGDEEEGSSVHRTTRLKAPEDCGSDSRAQKESG